MKIISYQQGSGEIKTGVVLDQGVLDISAWITHLALPAAVSAHQARVGISAAQGGIHRWLQAGPEARAGLAQHVQSALATQAVLPALDQLVLYAPVPRPGKIIGVGRNYADHAKETGLLPFEKPRIIFKMPSSVCAPGQSVTRPASVSKMDFETELAVVIGGYGKSVAPEQALQLVAGYTIINDVSAREFQFDIEPAQTTFAKSMDGFAPMGPWLVSADEIPDPQGLSLSCWLNGKLMQQANTAEMIFSVKALIAYISGYMTLEPGDVIATGTPAGIGAFRKPPVYLQPGDHLRFEISQIGSMEHHIS